MPLKKSYSAHDLIPSEINTQHNSDIMMPKYTIYTAEGLVAFYPTLRKLFIEDEMLNICKLNHHEENCHMDTKVVLSGRHPHLHLIFLNPSLEPIIRNVVKHLIQLHPSGDPEDPHNFANCILMYPGYGKRFTDQPNRNCRSS